MNLDKIKTVNDMRTFYVFKIRKEYAILTKKNPYHLYKTIEQLYYVDQSEISLGLDLFEKIIEPLNQKQLDIELFKKYKDNYFYTKFRNIHQIHDIYRHEDTALKVGKSYLELESSIIRPSFLNELEEKENLFFCDFENKDYFWLETITI